MQDVREPGSIPGSGRSPGGGHGKQLQYSCWRILWTEEPGGLWSIGSQSRTQTTEQADTHLSYGKVPKGEVSQATSPGRLHPLLLSSQCLLLSEMPMFV